MSNDNVIDSTVAFTKRKNKDRLNKLKGIMERMTQLADRGIALQVWQPDDETKPPVVVNLDQVLEHYEQFQIGRKIKWRQKHEETETEGEEVFWLPKEEKTGVSDKKPPTKSEIT